MTPERALHALISQNAAVIAAGAAERVYAMRADQNAQEPFIVFQRTDSDRWRSINGPSGVAQAWIQIDVYAEQYYTAKDLAYAIEKQLDGFRGLVPFGDNSPQDVIKIAGIALQNDLDIFDQTDQPYLQRNSASYLVTYHQGATS